MKTYASSTVIVSPSTSSMNTPTTMNHTVEVIPLQHPNADGVTVASPLSSMLRRWQEKVKRKTMTDWIAVFLPCWRWIRTYNCRDYLQRDIIAGLTVGIMLVPQAMSYAEVAGLRPIYGLYTGLVPVFVYAIFGSAYQLAIGPSSTASQLVYSILGSMHLSSELYTELAMLLALMVGIIECTMGLLRLGWLIRFISHSVISGFLSALALVIGLSQAKYFLGYNFKGSSQIIPLVKNIISGADKFSWPPFMMGSIILAILLAMKRLGKTRKNLRFLQAACPLTAVVLGAAIVKIFHPSSIALVGEIPRGLPPLSLPKEFGYVKSLMPTAILIAGLSILESLGMVKALSGKNGYQLDSNQEMFGLGMANIVGSFFSAYPSSGCFSRTAVNQDSGAKTCLSGIVMAIVVACAMLFMTKLFEHIPQCALAAIIISAMIGLVDYEEAIFLWRVDKKDFFLWTITCATTLFLGVEIGVLVGVGFSLAFVIYESANPHIAILGQLPGTTVYRNIQQYPEAYTYNGIVIVQIDAPIYFANSSFIIDRLREYESVVDQSRRCGLEVERIYFVILEMTPVTYVDSSAVQALIELCQEYTSRGIQMAITNPNREVLLTLTKAELIDLVGKEWCFVRVHDAVQVCLQQTQMASALNPDKSSTFLERLNERRKEDVLASEIESGERKLSPNSKDVAPELEPLMPRETS